MSGKILKSEFAEFEDILKGLISIVNGLSSVNIKIEDVKKTLGTATGLKDIIDAQKKINDLQKQNLINQKLITQTETAAAMAIKKKNDAEISNLKLLKEKEILEKNIINTASARIRQDKLIESQTKKNTSAFGGLIASIKSMVLTYLSIQTVFSVLKSLFETTKELDSLNFSYQKIIQNQYELGQTQNWLIDISKRLGVGLLDVSERYLKFRAAAQTTKLTVKETQGIFESFAKAGSVLGLRGDELHGIFLALEQMISKNTVTTEELRRQLGEKLPGAVQIMALSLKVTTGELNKMLKAGSVVAEETLPNMAKVMERVYGIESVSRVDTLAAAQGRLTTAWIEYVKALSTEGSSSFFKLIFEEGERAIAKMTYDLNKNIAGAFVNVQKADQPAISSIIDSLNEIPFDKLAAMHEQVMLQFDTQKIHYAEKIWKDYYKSREIGNKNIVEQNLLNAKYENKSKKELEVIADERTKQINDLAIEYKSLSTATSEAAIKRKKEIKETEPILRTELDIVNRFLKLSSFDSDKFNKDLDKAKDDYSKFKAYVTDEEKKQAKSTSEALKTGANTEKEFLLSTLIKLQTEDKYKNKILDENDSLSAQMIIRERLYEIDKKESKEKNAELIAKRKQNEIELSKFLAQQYTERMAKEKELANNSLLTEKEKDDELKDFIAEQETVYLGQKLFLNDQLKKYAKSDKEDLQEIEKDHYDIIVDIQKGGYENQEAETKRHNDIQIENAKTLSDTVIFRMESDINDQQLILIKGFEKEVKLKNLHGKKYILAKRQLEKDLLQVRIDEIEQEIKLGKLVPDEQEKRLLEVQNLKEQIAKQDTELTEKTEKEKLEIIQKYADAGANIINAGFDFASQIYANQLARAERTHELELLSATESAEGKMAADAKYDKKKREIEKRQAILKKASGSFNIIVDTAQAIMSILSSGYDPILAGILAAAAGITGGIELATVLAEPIPAYNKGAKGAKGGLSILGDKDQYGHGGVELVEEPGGKKWLSGSEPGLYNIVPGSDIYPSDETQKILAQQAFNNSFNIVGLGETNSILKDINKNTKNKIWFENGKKFKQHGNIITEYV